MRGSKLVAIVCACQMAAACAVPGHMHVTNGIAPQNADTNVRFRTTYYFRVFDYCWNDKTKISDDLFYKQIVPETDTLYRYRMTGKASALANQIHFESGTLDASQIDPFGEPERKRQDVAAEAQAARDADTAREAAEAQRELSDRTKREARQDFEAFVELLRRVDTLGLTKAEADERKAEIRIGIQAAVKRLLGVAPPDEATTTRLSALAEELKGLDKRIVKLEQNPPTTDDYKKLDAKIDELAKKLRDEMTTATAAKIPKKLDEFCSLDQIRRRGFQIMGPEGMRNFDQDSRLILAMHSSAKPLIETLSEYSGRLLRPQVNANDQLLPLARETINIVETQRGVDRAALELADGAEAKDAAEAKSQLETVFNAALAAFSAGSK
jgi:hypothetical protein